MNYTTLYEAEKGYPFPMPIIFFLIIALILIALIILLRKKAGFIAKCTMAFFSVMIIYTSLSMLLDYNRNKTQVYDKYFNGQYETCVGKIQDYATAEELKRNYDVFKVSNIIFVVDPYSEFGYHDLKSNGGKLDKDVEVRIYYVPLAADNIIMKLEILE